ncbi:hypothetical protein BCR36DRAFT_584926 [Piromyces finnis]|uniref:HCP-like protein n=1 Tax=Piromyces finnis TaxID=1754191 RepID=A0A1Y1V5B6_9FUNG|nr:hypothetical protein BCR36DRAFT_584926 [Piromyces finnis]|eukprot:ORX47113.1 hypothetical protein BCR36DRAFT_584926 [Piromyces finnis]
MENKENISVNGNCMNLSEKISNSTHGPNMKKNEDLAYLSNNKDNNELESEYYSCSNNTSFNTTIYNEPSLSLSFIIKDDKDTIPKYNGKNDIFTKSQSFKHIKKNSNNNNAIDNSNPNRGKSVTSLNFNHYNSNTATDVKSKGVEDELEFYKKRAESIFIKYSSHPYVKKFNAIPIDQKYKICLLAWKKNNKSFAIEVLESIVYDSGNRKINSNSKTDLVVRQANKFLGFCYLTGDGIRKNVEKAVMYFKKSNTSDSLFLLGIIYFSGYIEKEDAAADNLRLAEKWFKMAAEQGHLSSQIMLLYLMYMEEEQSISKHRERNVLIDESKLEELNYIFNDESLQKVTDHVKRINHNILNSHANIDKNSNFLINKSSSSSLTSLQSNSLYPSTIYKSNWSNDTRSIYPSTLNTTHTIINNYGGDNRSNGGSYCYPPYNYSFSSGSNINSTLPSHTAVNKNDYFKLNHKLSMETINYANHHHHHPNNTTTSNNLRPNNNNTMTSKYLINNDGTMKSSLDLATQNRHKNILYWLIKAANHRNVPPFIFFELGYYYQNGIGTEKNLEEATYWYQCLVDRETEYLKQYPWINNNILYAKYQLARLAPSAHQSIDWLIRAANDGNAMAQTCLGQYYFEQHNIQHKMQQYIVKNAKTLDTSLIFGKKIKSFENVHFSDNLQHMDGFKHFFDDLVEKIYEQDQQNEWNKDKDLVPEIDFLNNFEVGKEEVEKEKGEVVEEKKKKKEDSNSILNYSHQGQREDKTLYYFSSSVNNSFPTLTTPNKREDGVKSLKLFKKLTFKPFDALHTKTTNRNSVDDNDHSTITPKIFVKRNEKIKSFKELKKLIYHRMSSKSKKSKDHSISSMVSSSSRQHEKSFISINNKSFMFNSRMHEKSFVTAPNESKLIFPDIGKNDLSTSISIDLPKDRRKMSLTTDFIMSHFSLFRQWNLLDTFKSSLQGEIAKFIQENYRLFEKNKKYENRMVSFSEVNTMVSSPTITTTTTAVEAFRKGGKKEKVRDQSNKLKKKKSFFNILIFGKNKSKTPTLDRVDECNQKSTGKNYPNGGTLACSPLVNSRQPTHSTTTTTTTTTTITTSMGSDATQGTATLPQDDHVKMGLYWLSSAANRTNNNDGPYFVAQYILGTKYEDGKQLGQNIQLSIFWLKRALEKFTEENINSVLINETFNHDLAIAKEELENPQHYYKSPFNGGGSGDGVQNKFGNSNLNGRSYPPVVAMDAFLPEETSSENKNHEDEHKIQSIPIALTKSIKKSIKKRSHFYSKKDRNDTFPVKEKKIYNALAKDDKLSFDNRLTSNDLHYPHPFTTNDTTSTSTTATEFNYYSHSHHSPFTEKEVYRTNNPFLKSNTNTFSAQNPLQNNGTGPEDDLIFSDILTNYKISKNGDKIVKKKMSKFMNVSKNIYSTLSSPLSRSHSLKEGKYGGHTTPFLLDHPFSKDTYSLDRYPTSNGGSSHDYDYTHNSPLKKFSSLGVIKLNLKDNKERNFLFKHRNRSHDEIYSIGYYNDNNNNYNNGNTRYYNDNNNNGNTRYYNDNNNNNNNSSNNYNNGNTRFYNAYPTNTSNQRLNQRRGSIVSNINMRGPQDYETMNSLIPASATQCNDKEKANFSSFLNNTSLPPPYRSRVKQMDKTNSVVGKKIPISSEKISNPSVHRHIDLLKYQNANQPLSEIIEATETEITEDVSYYYDIEEKSEIIQMPSPKPKENKFHPIPSPKPKENEYHSISSPKPKENECHSILSPKLKENECHSIPSPKPTQENNSLHHNQSQNKTQTLHQSCCSLKTRQSKRSIIINNEMEKEKIKEKEFEEEASWDHSSHYSIIKRKSQSRKEANDLILNTSTLSSKKLMSRKKKRLRSKKKKVKTGDTNSSRKLIHSLSNEKISFSGEFNHRLSNSQTHQHSSFLSPPFNEDSMESNFIYSHSPSKINSWSEISPSLASIESLENSVQKHKLESILNNLINLKITDKELKKEKKRKERKRLKERMSSSSTMVTSNDALLLSFPPSSQLPLSSQFLPSSMTHLPKTKGMIDKPISTTSILSSSPSPSPSSQQQPPSNETEKLAKLETAVVTGSTMLTTYSIFSLFLSSESFSSDIKLSNEVISIPSHHHHHHHHQNSNNHLSTSLHRHHHHHQSKNHLTKICPHERESSKSTLFSDSNSSIISTSSSTSISSSTTTTTTTTFSESSFSTNTILTEASHSQSYSLVTSYLSSLSPMAEAEISSSFYSEIEDLFQLVKSKLEASFLTTKESDYYSYADIVYQLGLCYHSTDNFLMMKLMYQAAARGHAKAQYLLGRHFLLGQVLPFSLNFGVHWLTLSADQGHPDALYDLGCLSLYDPSSPYYSVEQGKSYLQLALNRGHPKAEKILNQLKQEEQN